MTRRNPKNYAQQSIRRPAREAYSTRRVEFTTPIDADPADADRLSATLYLPDRPANPPVIVMAPGLGAWRTFGYPAYAERFAQAGYATLLFDFRCHNDSDGEPRSLVAIDAQIEDYEAAIATAKRLDAVDGTQLVLWGYSLSGGHVLSVAADRFDVDAVIAMSPFTDGRNALKRMLRQPKRAIGSIARGLRDRIGSIVGVHYHVPIVGDPGSSAVVTSPSIRREYLDLVDRESSWSNETPARIFLSIGRYRPIVTAEEITTPTLLLAGTDDEVIPADEIETAADAIDDSSLVRFPATHSSPLGADFETSVGHQLTFLKSVFNTEALISIPDV